MQKFLVTGGAGFIGANFIKYVINKYKNIKVINLDKLTYAGNLENLKEIENNSNYKFIKGDICNKDLVKDIFNKYDIDYVVNFAAESHVDRSINNPEIFVKTNVLGTVNLLNCAKEAWIINKSFIKGKKFLQVSTDEVYGSLGDTGYFTENTPLNPHSPYSASKASADCIVKAYYDTYQMPVNITRCSNNYGPNQFPEKLIPLVINNCLQKKNVPVYGKGLNVRDWLYVEDHCRALDLVMKQGKSGEVYNIGGNNEKTNIEIVKLIIRIISEKMKNGITEQLIKFVEDRKGHDWRYAISAEKIRKNLGWSTEFSFEVGIDKTIDWYLNNRAWLENSIS
ncbi:dTDP-glucose 4,6-dehydratase [Clostridium ganghwense]|uniref:dTDP-glucose 4,6-dehydratase n=1 Tax=Clostridium ganghwense TaxID=312089 RepID=A0ABT4CN94_9CLOT|nr:dTDP-glucose 4,6-dehydratase [Clostridium ganghwense]MCY6370538.1 dTDP-glucose 4,6-dehydratase [Clostridium ganghwense]